jgi:hypothetical protein
MDVLRLIQSHLKAFFSASVLVAPIPGIAMEEGDTRSKQQKPSATLKGHGNEADFLEFLHKPVRHRSITLRFEPFRFWLRIRGDIRYRKTIP